MNYVLHYHKNQKNGIEPWGCIQECNEMGVNGICPSITKEDCLILNIFTPNNNNLSILYPVMIYIHGGGIRLINYRLGALGTLYNEELNLYGI